MPNLNTCAFCTAQTIPQFHSTFTSHIPLTTLPKSRRSRPRPRPRSPSRASHPPPTSLFFNTDNTNNTFPIPFKSTTSPLSSTSSRPKIPPNQSPTIQITTPQQNTRSISSTIHISASPSTVFSVLSDYSNLATVVPNLAISRVKGVRDHDNATILEQRGVQKILGFQFAASVVLLMKEVQKRVIEFDLMESREFKRFMGRWDIRGIGEQEERQEEEMGTRLTYEVTVSPKGLVPVKAIEWRIKEDVPGNMKALKKHCENLERRLKRRQVMNNQNGKPSASNNSNELPLRPVIRKKDITVA